MTYDYDSREDRLRLAAQDGDTETVIALLEQGADIHAAPVKGMTAARLALKYDHLDTVSLLLERGALLTQDDARTPEQVRFLQELGVEAASPDEVERLLLPRYERGVLSWEELQIATGKLPDLTLTKRISIEEVEAGHCIMSLRLNIMNKEWKMLKARMQPGDELWEFNNGLFDQLAGRAGYKLVRQGRVIAKITTFLS